jgi:hypothetical protein
MLKTKVNTRPKTAQHKTPVQTPAKQVQSTPFPGEGHVLGSSATASGREFKRKNRGKYASKRFEQEKFMPGSYGSSKKRDYDIDRGEWVQDRHNGKTKHNDTSFALHDSDALREYPDMYDEDSEHDSDREFIVSDGHLSEGEGTDGSESLTDSEGDDEEERNTPPPPSSRRKRVLVISSDDEDDDENQDDKRRKKEDDMPPGTISQRSDGIFVCSYHKPEGNGATSSELDDAHDYDPADLDTADHDAADHEGDGDDQDKNNIAFVRPPPSYAESLAHATATFTPAPVTPAPVTPVPVPVTAAPVPASPVNPDPFEVLYRKNHLKLAKSSVRSLIEESFCQEQNSLMLESYHDVTSIRDRRDKLVQIMRLLSDL